MKKLLLSFAACFMAFTMASAADITVDFSAAVDQLPAAETEELTTASIDGVNFTFYCCKGTGYQGANYLMVSGKKFEGAYVEFTVPQATKSFTLTTGSSASVAVMVQLSANGTNIGEAVKLDAKGADFKFDIPEANQAAGTTYRLTVTNKYNAQITKMVFSDTEGGSTEEPVDPTPSDGVKVTLANSVSDGTYALYVPGQGVATVYTGGGSFGYWKVEAVTVADNSFTTDAANLVTFANVAGKGYTMKDSNGKFIGMDASHFGAFNYYDTAEEANCYWNLEFTGNDVKISNTGREGAFITAKEYNGKWELVTSDNAETFIALQLFKGEAQQGGDPVEPEAVHVKSVKETIALANKTKFIADYALTVGWVFNRNVFVCDEAGDFIQIYGANTLKVGDVIPAGLEGTYELFNDVTPEITGATIPEASAGTFEAKVVAAADINTGLVNSVVTIENVVLAEASPAAKENFTGVADGIELSFRNNYTLESVEAGTYDITVVVTIYDNAPSLYVTNYKASTGVAGIEADANAPVEYFNLQGVRVANPENGLYIRRQGANVQKVMVR